MVLQHALEIGARIYETNSAKVMPDFERDVDASHSMADYHIAFLTEPGHAFSSFADLQFAQYYVNSELGDLKLRIPPRVSESSMMLVEDNQTHAMLADVLMKKGALKPYQPPAGLLSGNELEARNESRGHYTSAERALDVMYASGQDRPPDVILCDIELLGPMNGIQLVREIHRRETAAGRNPMILMVYSSNPQAFEEDLKALERDGVISGRFHKRDFDPQKFIDGVDAELERRSKA